MPMKTAVLIVNVVFGLLIVLGLVITSPLWVWLLPMKVTVNGNRVSIWSTLWSNSRSDGSEKNYTRLQWFIRNPFHEFSWYVIGIVDTGFTTHGYIGDALLTLMSDAHKSGWIVCYRKTESGWRLPFVSYSHIFTSGNIYQFYFGWRPHGAFGIKHRIVG